MRPAAVAFLVQALLVCAGCTPDAEPEQLKEQSLEVTTRQGPVRGTLREETRVFLGLPYAASTAGQNRFRPPQPPTPWTEVRAADKHGPVCPQFMTNGKLSPEASEDCLSLGVWTPRLIGKPLPVMVWVHGGGFTSGAGSEPTFDGTHLSSTGGVVIVTVNYRLGPLGFLGHEALEGETPGLRGSGNWGLLDQQAALAWVRDNIAAFGGDPANVTLFGQSAGGLSVCHQLVSPRAAGLFNKVIVQSGPCVVFTPPDRTTANDQGRELARVVGCDGGDAAAARECLRAKPVAELMQALPLKTEVIFGDGYGWTPNIDGDVLPDAPKRLLAQGSFNRVPVMVGATKDEGTLFTMMGLKVDNEEQVRKVLATLYPKPIEDAVVARYAPITPAAGLRILNDAFVCDARLVARRTAAASPTWYYHFTRAFEFLRPDMGAFHCAELPYVWGNPFMLIPIKEQEEPFAAQMQGYWTRFARASNPDTGAPAGTVAWPGYTGATDTHLELDLEIKTGTGLRRETCDFWDGLLQ